MPPDIWDPVADKNEVNEEYNINLIDAPSSNNYHAIVLAVKHRHFTEKGLSMLENLLTNNGIIYDIKEVFQ